MAPSGNDPAALYGLLPRDSPVLSVDQLTEELVLQRAVLDSLLDLPDSTSTRADIAAAKAEITGIQRKLAEARSKGPGSSARMAYSDRPNRWDSSTPLSATASGTEDSGTTWSSGFGSSSSSRKRSIGSSHLGIGASGWGTGKSRRTSPSPGRGSSRLGSGGFGSDDIPDVIDLTGDDNDWREIILRQKEAEERSRQRKAVADRDAAFARQLSGWASPGSSVAGPSAVPGTSFHGGSTMPHRTDRSGSTLPSRPHALARSQSGSLAYPGPDTFSGISTLQREPAATGYRMPGTFVEDSDSDSELSGFGRYSQSFGAPARPSRPSLPSLASAIGTPAVTVPTLPSMSGASTPPGTGFGSDTHFQYGSSVPAIELARQSSMAGVGASVAWPPVGPIGSMLGPNRFGYPNNVGYTFPSLPTPSAFSSSLGAIINRTSNYDFNAMMDANGNPLSDRLVDFLDDYVNDPRKTEEDITQLLSNIRPDMEIPEEERGETPEAMRYSLYAHQQLALKWMTDMEEGTNKGGILADDMGLGKTISTLALMVSRPSSDKNIKTNLIIGPVALIKQWEQEVRTKLKTTHKLSVLLLHQKKKSYSEIKRYDVVLTTYGSLAMEWRRYSQHVESRKLGSPQYDEDSDMELATKCPLLHARSKFYRIILDEAQCIKNKRTQGSMGANQLHAVYRWCLTGTPMMNNVSELYPLIRFLKIRPYCDFKMFQQDFGGLAPKSQLSDNLRSNAMRKLQAVLKAMMLRRMKSSTIDGKPILTLPEKTQNDENVTFNDDERQFYQNIESRTQILFNRYLRAGTIGRNYSNILVLLLRLRQACCHPHLMEFESAGTSNLDSTMMLDLAKKLDATVIERVKAIEAFECCICYDAVEDPVLIFPCGHDTCPECFTSLTENSAQNNIRFGEEGASAKCPVCRGPVEPAKVINLTTFRKVHAPEALAPEDVEELAEETDSDDSDDSGSSTASDAESDADSDGNLKGFIVPDGEVGDLDDDDLIDAELDAAVRVKKDEEAVEVQKPRKKAKKTKKSHKTNKEGKSKSKREDVTPQGLKKLRFEANKNKEARRRYMHYLRDNWEDSAKVTQVVNLLRQIQESDEKTIVFSQFTALLDLIEVQVKYTLQLRYCRYTGSMSRNQRDEAVRDFTENPANKVMLVSLRAGNAGLNLTAASRIIICDPFWNPYIEMQAVDRAHRIGQSRPVQVHRILVEGTVEDRIVELQENKRKLVDAALDEGESKNLGRLSERELAYLFGVNPRPEQARSAGPARTARS